MNINKEKIKYVIIQVMIMIISLVVIENISININFKIGFFIIQYMFSIYIGKKIYGNLNNIFIFLLGTLFMFNFGRIILTLFGQGDYGEITWFAHYNVGLLVKNKVLLIAILSVQSLTIGMIIFKGKNINKTIEFDKGIFNIAKTLFLITGAISSIRIIGMIGFTLTNGYMGYYGDGYEGNIILSIADDVFRYSFYAILMSNPKFEKIKKYILAYAIMQIAIIFTGFRGFAISEILTLIIYIGYKNKSYIKLGKLTIIGLLCMLISISVGNIRMGEKAFGGADNNQLLEFVESQGYSLNVLSLVVEDRYKQYESNFNYLIYPIKDLYSNDDKDIFDKVKNKSLAHVVSCTTNSDIYKSGGGMGGNYIAELYAAKGIIGVILGNIIFSGFICFFDKRFFENRIYIYICMYIFPYILIAPRDYFLNWIMNIIRASIFILFILIMNKIIYKNVEY